MTDTSTGNLKKIDSRVIYIEKKTHINMENGVLRKEAITRKCTVRPQTENERKAEAIAKRSQWKKFGEAVDSKGAITREGGQVFFEYCKKNINADNKWVPNALYVKHARDNDWSQSDILTIVRSDCPDKTWEKIFRMKMSSLLADLTPPSIKHYEDGDISIITNTGESIIEIAPGVKLGLKARMEQKERLRKNAETPVSAGVSLSDKLRVRQEQNQDNEQLCTLFLENVPSEYIERDIKDQLSNYDVRRINIVKRDNGYGVKESVGKAFVVLHCVIDAEACQIYLNQCRWEHHVVSAMFSKPRK